jgi:hypothetical protein
VKVLYKGFEIDAHREESMGGDRLLYYSIFRESDGWEMTSGFTYGSDRVQTFIKYLKEWVDNYILHPEEESE